MTINTDNMVLNIDGASFNMLAVAGYAASNKTGNPVYNNILLTNRNGYIYAYGSDMYQVYRTRIECKAGKVEAASDLRILLRSSDIISIAKSVKPDMNVSIFYKPDALIATISTHYLRGGKRLDETAYTAWVFVEDCYQFPDDKLEEIFLNSSEHEPCYVKAFNLALVEKLTKSIKTAVSSASEKKNLTVEITRSGRNKAEVFTYREWFDAALMPIKMADKVKE